MAAGPLGVPRWLPNKDTGAADNEELVSFGPIGAEVKVGSLVLGGEGRNFAFLGDGTFITKPGFGVFLTVGSASGDSFMWPKWLPIQITEVGITWPDIQKDPCDFLLTLSASVSGIQGMAGIEFSGTIDGIKIDVGKLLAGKFPIVDIASIGVTLKGDLFGGQINAGLIGGILKLDALGNVVDNFDTTTKVEERIFFVGVEGGFSFSGLGGFTVRFAVSELGPLGVYLSVSVPGGILIEPHIQLCLNDFSAGVEFFKSLPSIEEPEELRGSAFDLPTGQTADQWLSSVKQQVIAQYQAMKANPSIPGFLAAFTSPMLITGGAKIFTRLTSQQVFNGEVVVRFSTDGKFLIIGKLNFAADNLSISGKLYFDLSKVVAGDVTVLFLADIPEQVELLTIDGKLKMGFRDPSGEEVVFTVVETQMTDPYARLAGPENGGVIGLGSIKERGYIDVIFPDTPDGTTAAVLDIASVTDLTPEFKLPDGSGLRLDNPQARVHLGGNEFRFWVHGAPASGNIDVTFLKETWSYTTAIGEQLFNEEGAYEDQDNVWQGEAENTENLAFFILAYIDVKFVPGVGAEIDQAAIDSIILAGVGAMVIERESNNIALSSVDPTYLGNSLFRYYFDDPADIIPGSYDVTFVAGQWQDSAGVSEGANNNTDGSAEFAVVVPSVSVAGPFTAGGPIVDVNVFNAQTFDRDGEGGAYSPQLYIDVLYTPSPGSGLDYDSIMDAGDEFKLWIGDIGGTEIQIDDIPIPLAMEFNDDFVLEAVEQDADPAMLAENGITRFRYLIDAATTSIDPNDITIEFLAFSGEEGWQDAIGNAGDVGAARKFVIEGPAADLVSPTDGANIDIGELNNRNYIDVTFPNPSVTYSGYSIDENSIEDLSAEFILGGPGLGSVVLDSGQAPVNVGANQWRYWVSGTFEDGDVTLEFIPGSWSLVADASAYPGDTGPSVELTDATHITVDFDNIPAGFELDPDSIFDSMAEFTLTHSGGLIIEVLDGETPERVEDSNT